MADMLLAVDIGNTSTKLGIFDSGELTYKFSFPTSFGSGIQNLPGQFHGRISSAIVCSVVHEADAGVAANLGSIGSAPPVFVTSDLDFGMAVRYAPISTLGTDRLVNAYAAMEKYGSPIAICSFGTATTIDIVDGDKTFLGGVIAPGLKTSAIALSVNTSQLPEVEIEFPASVIGSSTEAAIQAGVGYGHVSMVDGLISRMRQEMNDSFRVVATGGFASRIAAHSDSIDILDEDLTLEGLYRLAKRIGQA